MTKVSDPLERLTPRQREVIHLAHHGWSDAQICGVLGISPGTLRWHTHKIRKVLPAFLPLLQGYLRNRLTKREQDLARLVAAGMSNQDIAKALNMSRQAVANRLSGIYRKTQTENRVDLACTILIVQNRILIGRTEAA